MGAASNPFSACFVRPGAIPWVAVAGAPTMTELAQRIEGPHVFQIVGAHGSGKTTLLRHLAGVLESSGRAPCFVRPTKGDSLLSLAQGCRVALVDEIESLSPSVRFALRLGCRARRIPLVVACHVDMGHRCLARTVVSPEVARQVVALLAGAAFTGRSDVEARVESPGTDLRELLFGLYDIYETSAKSAPSRARGSPR